MENSQSAKELAIAFIIKYGFLVALVTIGGAAQVLLSNQKEKLNWVQNLAIFFTCCLVGGSWGYYFFDNRPMLTMSGIVSLLGYHLATVLVLLAKDKDIVKKYIKDKL